MSKIATGKTSTKKYTKVFPAFQRLVKVAHIPPAELQQLYQDAGHSVSYGTMWNWHARARGDTDLGLGIPKWVEWTAKTLWEKERDRQKRQAVLNVHTDAAEAPPEQETPTQLALELEKWETAKPKLEVVEDNRAFTHPDNAGADHPGYVTRDGAKATIISRDPLIALVDTPSDIRVPISYNYDGTVAGANTPDADLLDAKEYKAVEVPERYDYADERLDEVQTSGGEITLRAPHGRRLELDDIIPMIRALTKGKVRSISIDY